MAENDNSITGIERLMIEELLSVFLCAFEPEQFAHTAGPQNVVPHDARVGQRIEAQIGAIARVGFLHRQH